MRRTVPRVSYFVRDRTYDLPELFPDCQQVLEIWVRHCMYRHEFIKTHNSDTVDEPQIVLVTQHDRYVCVNI